MNLTTGSRVFFHGATKKGIKKGATSMRKAILGAASALALASPAMANGVTPYSEVPSYGGETHAYEYRTTLPIVVEELAAVVVARRPVLVAALAGVVEYER